MDLSNKVGGKTKRKFNLEQVKQFIEETGGKVAIAAKRLGCCPGTLYKYIDEEHPELKDDIKAALQYAAQARIDNAEYVKETIVDLLDTDPALALKSAQSILRRQRSAAARGWITDEKTEEESTHSLAELAEKASTGELSQRD